MHLNQESKGYSQFPSYKEAKTETDTTSNETDGEYTDPCNPKSYLIRHYRNGDGSTDAWVVCLREYLNYRAEMLHTDAYHEFEVHDYKYNDLPDFGGFEFIYVNEDENEDCNVVGFTHKEDAESIVQTLVEENKKSTFYLVEDE